MMLDNRLPLKEDANKSRVEKRVQEHYDFVCKKYGESNVFFVTLYGSQNYSLDTPESDVDTKAVVFLSGSDLVWGESISVEEHLENGEHCEVKDLVSFCRCLAKQNLNFLEVFASKAIVVNPRYMRSFENFQRLGQQLVRYDMFKLLVSCSAQSRHHLQQFLSDPEHKVKQLVNSYRLAAYCRDMAAGLPFSQCVQFTDSNRDELLRMKREGTYTADFLDKLTALLDEVAKATEEAKNIPRNEYAYIWMRNFCLQMYHERLSSEGRQLPL